jgi:Spy/CpxP family protein refolding chaperone
MKTKIFLTIALAALLTGGFSIGGAVTDAVAQSSAEVVPPDQPVTPDPPTVTCPKCGNECPMPQGHRGRQGIHAPKAHKSYGRASRMHAPHASRGGGFGLSDRVPADQMLRSASDLDLTDAQVSQLENLSYDAKSKLIDLNSSLEKARLEMKKEMESGNDNLSALKKNLESMSKIKVDIQELKLGNWFEAKKVLTEEQKAKVKDHHPRFGSSI